MNTRLVLDLQLVEEFVSKAYGDLEHVKFLLINEPALVNAAWDWGGGEILRPHWALPHIWAEKTSQIFCLTTGQGSISLQQRCLASWKS